MNGTNEDNKQQDEIEKLKKEELNKLKKENNQLKTNNNRLKLETIQKERLQTEERRMRKHMEDELKKENNELKVKNEKLKLEKTILQKQKKTLEKRVKTKQINEPTREASHEEEQLHCNNDTLTDEIGKNVEHRLPFVGVGTNGVFNYLNKNSATKIVVTRSSDGPAEAKDIPCHASRKSYGTKEEKGSWWRYELGENYSLFITHCTLTRNTKDPILGNWILKGSTNCRKWNTLAKTSLVNPFRNAKCTWSIREEQTTFRYFKILQNGENRKNPASKKHAKYGIFLSHVELYGSLLQKEHGAQISERCTPSKSKLLSSLLDFESSLNEVCAVLDTSPPRCGTYRAVAQHYGFRHHEIESVLRTHDGGPSRSLIESLAATHPELTVQEFAVVIEEKTKRKDASRLLKKYDAVQE